MSGTASSSFFWNDWQGDPLLKLCSFAAQGVWMRLLCIAAESKRYGYVLVNGRTPTVEELVKVIGGAVDEVTHSLCELDRNGVSSRTRQGTIYCRRMVRDAKKRAASAKGGKKGGAITYGNKRGIFNTQGGTQDATQGCTQPPFPSLPISLPERRKKEVLEILSGKGKKNGAHVFIEDPKERLARFQATVAKALGPKGWEIVASAADTADPCHDANKELCRQAAKSIGKGWPRAWN